MKKIKVIQFAKVINKDDFIDNIIRFADTGKYVFTAVTFTSEINISDPQFSKRGIPVYSTNTTMSVSGLLKAVFRLRRILKKELPDIIHPHHFYESLIAVLAVLTMGEKIKVVVGRHYDEEIYLSSTGLKRKIYLFFEGIANSLAQKIIVPSEKIRSLMVKQGVPGEKVKVIHYPFNFSSLKYDPAQKRESEMFPGKFIIANIARQHPIKGQEFLLKGFKMALKENSNIRLIMVGTGKHHDRLKQLTGQEGLSEFVYFAGWRKDALTFLDEADMVIHPTLQEAFPQIMIEAMAKEKFLVITPVSGAGEIIEHKKNGFLIPFKNPESIKEAIEFAVSNQTKITEIGKNARKYVLENLKAEDRVKDYLTVYEQVLGN